MGISSFGAGMLPAIVLAAAGALPVQAQGTGEALPPQPAEDEASQEAVPPKEKGTFSFVLENDLFVDTDRHYTNGVRLSWLTAPGEEPDWVQDAARRLPIFTGALDIRVEFALGQSMFTPTDTSRRVPDPTDRPYAGWLYGNVGVVAETRMDDGTRRLDQVALGLGVVGPLSLAKQSQNLVHDVRNLNEVRGWRGQLKNEPTVQLTWQTSWQARTPEVAGFAMDATPHVGAAVGNVFDYANAGVTFRFGQHLPDDYGPPRVEPSLPGSGFFKSDGGFGWYLFGGVDGRAVARNLFLDGNTFRSSPDVEKKHFVGDLQVGAAIVVGDVRIAYTQVFRTREYEGQKRPDQFGAVSVSTRF